VVFPARGRLGGKPGAAGNIEILNGKTLPPKAHAEIGLPAEHGGARLERVEVKAAFRVASYVVGRRAESGELVLFDHLFTYAR